MEQIQTLTFEEWKKRPAVIEMDQVAEKCDTCYGSGEHECECGDTHTCGDCDGDGKLFSLRETYERILREEIHRLRVWISGEKLKEPSENLIPDGHDNDNKIYARLSMPGKIESGELIIAVSKDGKY